MQAISVRYPFFWGDSGGRVVGTEFTRSLKVKMLSQLKQRNRNHNEEKDNALVRVLCVQPKSSV